MRYLPLNEEDRAAMRVEIGIAHIDELFSDVPNGLLNPSIDLPDHQGELQVERALGGMAAKEPACRRRDRFSSAQGLTATMCRRLWTISFSGQSF